MLFFGNCHPVEDRRGIRLVIEADVGLIICVWDPVDQSDSPLSRATVGIRLDTRTNEKENKEKGDVKQKDEKARSSIPRSDMTTRTKNDCFVHKTYDLSDAKCSREKCACCARLMGCTVRRFSDTLSCNGFLRAYLSFCFWFEFECLTIISESQGSRTGIPSMRKPVFREIISDSVAQWDRHVCFWHIQLIGTNVWLPNTHNDPPEVDFESSRFPAVSKSWSSHNLNCWTAFPTWQYWWYSLVKWMQEIKRARRLSQALAHFVIACVSLLTVHRISGSPIRVKYRHFRTIWEHSI